MCVCMHHKTCNSSNTNNNCSNINNNPNNNKGKNSCSSKKKIRCGHNYQFCLLPLTR